MFDHLDDTTRDRYRTWALPAAIVVLFAGIGCFAARVVAPADAEALLGIVTLPPASELTGLLLPTGFLLGLLFSTALVGGLGWLAYRAGWRPLPPPEEARRIAAERMTRTRRATARIVTTLERDRAPRTAGRRSRGPVQARPRRRTDADV